MASITRARLAQLRASRPKASTTSARSKVLELVFAAGSSQFSLRLQRAIQGVIANKKDRPIAAIIFSAGRTIFGEPVKSALARVIANPDDFEGIVEFVLVFPEQLVGAENNKLSDTMDALVQVGVDRDALLLVQDITLGSGKVARLFVRAAKSEDQSQVLPGLMVIAGELWPEIQRDIQRIEA